MQTTMEEPGDDLLSQLPSDVLVSVLDKVSLRDAVRAGVFSRRWRDLPSQIPRLVFDMEDFMPDDEHDAVAGDDSLAKASNAMKEAAKSLLASRAAGAPACTVAMSILLRRNYKSLGRLLDDAVASGKVRGTELTVTGLLEDSSTLLRTSIALDRYGGRFKKLFGGCPAAFGCLTRLTLANMAFRRLQDLVEILSTCTELETMSMSLCGVFGAPGTPEEMWRLRHARLTDVEMLNCGGFDGLVLEWLPRLERFAYKDWDGNDSASDQQPLSFGHVPRLKTLTMSKSNTPLRRRRVIRLSEILANTAVSVLRLNFRGQNIWVKPEAAKRFETQIFHNLEHLKICNVHQECGLTWTMFLLQAAPNLKELCIKLRDHECDIPDGSYIPIIKKKKNVPWDVPVDFKHYNLTRITILGFYNTGEGIVTFLRSLVQAAAKLEEIHIRENKACKECGVTAGIGPSFPWTDKDKDRLRESISDGGGSTSFKICLPYRIKRF